MGISTCPSKEFVIFCRVSGSLAMKQQWINPQLGFHQLFFVNDNPNGWWKFQWMNFLKKRMTVLWWFMVMYGNVLIYGPCTVLKNYHHTKRVFIVPPFHLIAGCVHCFYLQIWWKKQENHEHNQQHILKMTIFLWTTVAKIDHGFLKCNAM